MANAQNITEFPAMGLKRGRLKKAIESRTSAKEIRDLVLDMYCAFLAHEHAAALAERQIRRSLDKGYAFDRIQQSLANPKSYKWDVPMYMFPEAPETQAMILESPPSSRAALVLGAVGIERP